MLRKSDLHFAFGDAVVASYLYPARLSAFISAMRVTVIAVYVFNTNHIKHLSQAMTTK
ncbi:hypothetical protein OPT79_81 [Klebsiella phage vB_KpnD_Opt-79]|nr:hypothetical protein OPT79_81 [Klebsiella phage vB_KpnD_Opt-79]